LNKVNYYVVGGALCMALGAPPVFANYDEHDAQRVIGDPD